MSPPESRAEREFDYDRTVALSDGVFAIALTLLVLSIDPADPAPGESVWGELLGHSDELLSYVISFAVIALFWIGHHSFFRGLSRIDTRLTALNLAYLGLVAFLPYPTELVGEHGKDATAVAMYATSVALVAGMAWLMHWHVERAGLLASPGSLGSRRGLAVVTLVFLVSVPLAFVDTTLAQLSWLVLFLQGRLRGHHHLPVRHP
jgi:uncharacterized membrane protein